MKPRHVAAEPVSAYDAKTHLPRLIERASRGERFVITRHGKPVAQLVPYEETDEAVVAQALAVVASARRKLARRGVALSDVLEAGETARGLSHAGHRY